MKRHELLDHLRRNGCHLDREGGRHSIYYNPASGARAPVPRSSFVAASKIARPDIYPLPAPSLRSLCRVLRRPGFRADIASFAGEYVGLAIGVEFLSMDLPTPKKGAHTFQLFHWATLLVLFSLGATLLEAKVISFLAQVPFLQFIPHSLYEKVGEALIIAVVLAGTVDLYVKRQLLQEAVIDVFPFMLGYSLPDEIKNEIRTLMQTGTLRREYDVCWSISFADANTCRVRKKESWSIENFTNTSVLYRQRSANEATDNPVYFEMFMETNDPRGRYHLRRDDGTLRAVVSDRVVNVYGNEIKLHPVKRGYTYRAHIDFECTLPTSYADVVAFFGVFCNVNIHVEAPPNLRVFIADDDSTVVEDGVHKFRRVFLPDQHIRIRWEPSGLPNTPSAEPRL